MNAKSYHKKILLIFSVLTITATGTLANTHTIRNSKLSRLLKKFAFIISKPAKFATATANDSYSSPYVKAENTFENVANTQTITGQVSRYQQTFHGIEVYGAQVTLSQKSYNGKLEDSIARQISVDDIAQYQSPDLQRASAERTQQRCFGKQTSGLSY